MNDVDVLVPPKRFGEALRLLRQIGFPIVHTRRDPDHWTERCMARLAKDVMLRDKKSGLNIELHRRLFFARAEEKNAPLLRDGFAPRLGPAKTDIPSPAAGAALALYLLLHGASSRWFRLKWLVDLLPLISKIDRTDVHAIAGAADQLNAAVSVKAGLQLFAWVFGEEALGPVAPWLNERPGKSRIDARAEIFLHAIDRLDASFPAREGAQLDSLDVYYAVADSPSYRAAVLLRGGAWIALRSLSKLAP